MRYRGYLIPQKFSYYTITQNLCYYKVKQQVFQFIIVLFSNVNQESFPFVEIFV